MTKTPRRKKINYHRFKTAVGKLPLYVYFTVLLVFACSLGVVFVNAYMQNLRNQIDRTRIEIASAADDNAVARANIQRHFSNEELEYIAQTRLGMHLPESHQIVHIYVPRQSFVIQAEAPPDPEPQGMWSSAWQYIVGWFGW